MKLQGKKALITGGSRGIGRGIAEVFADEGASVAIVDIDIETGAPEVVDYVKGKGGQAVAIQGDVSSRASMEAAFAQAWSELDGLDILVNNAGIETIVPFLELTDDQWTRLVDINQRGPWLCSQIFCQKLVAEKRPGVILNLGSIQAAKALPGRTHYAPTKIGMEAFTRNLSVEMAEHNIRVNCLHPGLIETDMTSWVMKDPEILPVVLSQISLGRAGQPRDMGKVAAFFCSDEAGYVTGQSLHAEGGWVGK